MSTLQSNSKRNRTVKRIGLSAALAASVVGVSLYERSNSVSAAGGVSPVAPVNPVAPGQDATATPTDTGLYPDGEYTGDTYDASHWGNVQVQAVIQNGQLSDIKILDYPASTRLSIRISRVALPYLMDEAIKAQSATVDIISGATLTSEAFMQSLQSALDAAAQGNSDTSTPAATTTGSQL